jgi:hypothetical protein
MNKLVIIRKIFKMLYPELKVIVRYNKQKHFEIILKNVKKTYIDDRYKVMLSIPGTNDLEVEYFLTSLFGYCPILNENNCVIKYLGKKGSNQISKPIP